MKKNQYRWMILLISFLLMGLYPASVLAQEANDSPSGAPVLQLGTRYYDYINDTVDVDWFKFQIPDAGPIRPG